MPHAHVLHLIRDQLHVGESALQLGVHDVGRHDRGRRIRSEHRVEDTHAYARDDGRLRGVFGKHGVGIERRPAGVALGGVVAVLVE